MPPRKKLATSNYAWSKFDLNSLSTFSIAEMQFDELKLFVMYVQDKLQEQSALKQVNREKHINEFEPLKVLLARLEHSVKNLKLGIGAKKSVEEWKSDAKATEPLRIVKYADAVNFEICMACLEAWK